MIGWMLIDWCLVAAQYQHNGSVSSALVFVSMCHSIYVFYALRNEVRGAVNGFVEL